MSALLVIVAACLACRIVPRLLVELIATVISIRLVIANRRAHQTMLKFTPSTGSADWDRRLTRVERRALRRGLDTALDLTELSSLLPHVAVRAHKLPGVEIVDNAAYQNCKDWDIDDRI